MSPARGFPVELGALGDLVGEAAVGAELFAGRGLAQSLSASMHDILDGPPPAVSDAQRPLTNADRKIFCLIHSSMNL